MRTIEIMGFFNNAIRSERGMVVQDALHNNGLLSFEDIKDEINLIYTESLKTGDQKKTASRPS
jgi:predicted RNA-binding protein with PIN domain